jgi:hypothetical protein
MRKKNFFSFLSVHLPPRPSQTLSVILYCTSTQGRGEGGRVEPERRLEGQYIVHKAWSKIPSQVYKHLPQRPFTGQFFQMRIFCLDFYESYLTTVARLRNLFVFCFYFRAQYLEIRNIRKSKFFSNSEGNVQV